MQSGQRSGTEGVLNGDRQFFKSLTDDSASNVIGQACNARHFADTKLGRDFPCGSGTDERVVGRICDCSLGD